jgi:DNA repair protein RecO (recombination protein O)
MLHKTRGIVLGFIKYSDTSIIAKVYTEAFGLQTYMVNGIRSKTSKNKIALFQPLTLLDMVVYHKEQKDINRISEMKCHVVFRSIPFDQKKISMCIFLSELLGKTLKEHYPNQELFELIFHTVSYLDEVPEKYENLHLQFMVQLAAFLGFGPNSADDIVQEIRISIAEEEKKILEQLMYAAPDTYIPLHNATRRHLLDCLIRYYAIHVENFGTLNSHTVLQEIFR